MYNRKLKVHNISEFEGRMWAFKVLYVSNR
jgi:hypothetical protein